ncbi:hypothetical protein [Streptomyces uncialis]|uniref:hypothetical protein n=1 Tax=Streptomyces uncialis TaxID=1048205 RepID=UPI0022551E96|nr:hypothetical protein [Streptomyces uncialis]MCX4658923.1 hypothetical protein [Streptomyces uncialis]
MNGRTAVSGEAEAAPPGERAVEALLSLSGRMLPLLRQWVGSEPDHGVARALLALATGDRWDEAVLKEQLVIAHRDARAAGEREASLVYGVFLHTHRQYRLTADHLVGHFGRWPADELAGLMLGAFSSCGDDAYRAHGDALVEEHAALAGPDSWPWTSWLAAARAEQGRVREAHGLAGRALALHPRSGVAAHALAHAEHELGAGPDCSGFLDEWLRADPHAVQSRHLHWHAALQSLACGDFPDARRRADAALARTDVGMRAATNWRLLLAGQSPAGRSDPAHVRELLAAPGGTAEVFHTFNLALALAVEAATDDLYVLARRAAADERADYREVLAPVVRALAEITAGRPGVAVELLSGLGEAVERIGGVRVEREIVQDTLARALVDTGDHTRAAGLLHHRTTTRRHHTYEDLLLAARAPAPTVGA